ncbi:uroporphyrinogen-III synthase [Meiothermus rufus]|uniref:uroporphyrinogen-III synthase n=1 Tax=Meiothermus rufus TaxID=604332 RepID=UPI000424838E|nr:uroporphyrinogen-III synthase [Meiothermus rufus]
MRIALTQSEGRLEGLEAQLEALGLEVWRVPLVRTQPLPQADLSPLEPCRWWLFTSVAAVQAVQALGASLAERWLGAVGPATQAALEAAGGRVVLVAPEGHALSLAEAFLARRPFGWVGLPLGAQARPTLAQRLTQAGYQVRSVVVYETLPQPWPATLPAPDLLLLASPSAVEAVPESIGRQSHALALGPTTAQALLERGWPHTQVAHPSPEGILQTVLQLRGEACSS